MKWKFLDSKNLTISRLGVLIPVPPSSILLKREAKESDIINFHVSVVILFAWSAVRSVLHSVKLWQWPNFCTDDKPLFFITASLFSAYRESAPPSFCLFLFFHFEYSSYVQLISTEEYDDCRKNKWALDRESKGEPRECVESMQMATVTKLFVLLVKKKTVFQTIYSATPIK